MKRLKIDNWVWNHDLDVSSISFPGDICSVISAVVAESNCAVIKKPVFNSWKSWLTCNISVPVFIDVDFQCVDDTSGRFSFIIKFTSINSLSNSAVSSDGAVGISIQLWIVKLWWPSSIGSVVGSIVVYVDGTVVVNPKGNTSKAEGSFSEDIPSFIDFG